jgi:hypothetical protein
MSSGVISSMIDGSFWRAEARNAIKDVSKNKGSMRICLSLQL